MKFSNLIYFLLLCCSFQLNAQSIEFIENRGQWDGPFSYKAVTGKGDVFLEKGAFTYLLSDMDNGQLIDAYHHGQLKEKPILKFHSYKVIFEGANEPYIEQSKVQKTYYNYFLGNDSAHWKTGIHSCLALDYKRLYNDIDMHLSSANGNLEYEFVLYPGADETQIKLRYDGAYILRIKDNNLLITTSVGQVTELAPYAYQFINDVRVQVPCYYERHGNVISFSFPNDYDHSKKLIIDPTIVFCTFTGSTADNWGFTATYDAAGNFYAGGIVHGTGYPVSTGAFQVNYGLGVDTSFNSYQHGSGFACDIGIIKFDPTGSSRIYATYIGGTDNEQPHSLIVDANNNLIIAGRTYSHDYPVTPGAYDISQNGIADIIVTKLNASATALLGSTYIGGSGEDVVNYHPSEYIYGNMKHNYGDDARSEVQIDNLGNIYVAACTKSTNFPVTANATQSSLSGTQDAVIFKMNSSLTSLIWSTYLGGSNDDAAYVLAFDNTQSNIYVAGGTQSGNFPSTTGTYHSIYQGGSTDGWIAKFQNGGSYTLQKATFIGTNDYDQCYGIQLDQQNNVFAMGQSLGGSFPVSAGVYSNPGSSQFIIKMDNNLSTNLYSTVFGSGTSTTTNISPVAFLVDTCENIYISGWGGNLEIPGVPTTVGNTIGMPVSANATQSTSDGTDFYFFCLSKNMATLQYASYFGRSSLSASKGEHVDGGTSRFDKYGVIYQGICGGCLGNGSAATAFPTTPGAYSTTNGNSNCNEAALKIAFQLGPVQAHASASPSASGCAPFTVQFQNTSTNGVSFEWDFADGATSTTFSPTHTFNNSGIYNVRLRATNANACTKIVDTFYLTISVDTGKITAQLAYTLLDSCGPFTAGFTNLSTTGPGISQYLWLFGDGATYNGQNPLSHNYPGTGSYTATLVMTDTSACNSPDSASVVVNFSNLITTAQFESPDTICVGTTANFTNHSINGKNYHWEFGDGQTSFSENTSHQYNVLGTFHVWLIASNPGACKGLDSLEKLLTIVGGPIADFSFAPSPPITNKPIEYTNLSSGAKSYQWDFGDGEGSTDTNPSHLFYTTSTFNTCLSAYSKAGCLSKICKDVPTDIQPLVDVPTAFSPNGDGQNDILYVRGASIKTMNLKIYNRWGELIFESNSQQDGWNGKYLDKPQEMEVYAFVLKAQFFDGTNVTKKGNITLLR